MAEEDGLVVEMDDFPAVVERWWRTGLMVRWLWAVGLKALGTWKLATEVVDKVSMFILGGFLLLLY